MRKRYDYMREAVLKTRRKIRTGEIDVLKEPVTEGLLERLKEILENALKNEEWEGCLQDIYEEIDNDIDGGNKEKEFHKKTMISISGIIRDIKNYTYDLWADTYLAMLRADSQNDVKLDAEMEIGWVSKACNSNVINVEKAKIHYPLVDYGDKDFPFDGIPGGCEEYHRLMMQQKNIGIFDIDTEKESLKQYAYPKSHEIYQELAKSPVENLLLLEKTLGIGYVNHLFHYMKKISSKDQLEGVEEIYEKVAEIPMFLRKEVTDAIWTYLVRFEYNAISVECMRKTVDSLTYIIEVIYKSLWQFVWQEFERGSLPWVAMKGTLSDLWKEYFTEIEVKENFLRSKNLLGYSDVESAEACFIRGDGNENVLFPRNKQGEEIANRLAEKQEIIHYFEEKEDDKKKGEEVLQEILLELKEQEKAAWGSVDPKRKTKRLTPMDVYAVVHEKVIQVLIS